jgi:hypothetical protein
MKTIVPALIVFLILVGCSKSSDNNSNVVKIPTLTLLTEKQWYFDSVYSNYTTPGTGQVTYARGSGSNIQNLDTAHFIYHANGLEDLYKLGHYQLSWLFTGADSTVLYNPPSAYNTVPIYQRILKLDTAHMSLYDSTNSALEVVSVNH